jgi:hypothetical protein
MDKKSLSSSDICKIIKACEKSSVSSFSYMGLELAFHLHRNASATVPGQASDHEYPVVSDSAMFSKDKEHVELLDMTALDEAEEAQLLIDDPFSFEKAQISKDIERTRQLNG